MCQIFLMNSPRTKLREIATNLGDEFGVLGLVAADGLLELADGVVQAARPRLTLARPHLQLLQLLPQRLHPMQHLRILDLRRRPLHQRPARLARVVHLLEVVVRIRQVPGGFGSMLG